MSYTITRTYYLALLSSLKKDNKMANQKSVIDYLNQNAGLLRKITTLKLSV